GRARGAAPHPPAPRRDRVRAGQRDPGTRDQGGARSAGCRRRRQHSDLHGARRHPAVARGARRRPGGEPRQPRAEPGRNLPHVLPRRLGHAAGPALMHGFALALRFGRWGILGYGALTFLNTTLQAVGFYQIAGKTQAARAAFGSNMALLASQFTVLLPEPVRLDTIGGYVQWRAFGFYAIPFAIWALASATGAARGDEELGLVEMVLSTGASRARFLTTRIAAFAAGSTIAALAGSIGLLIGVAIGQEGFSAGRAFAAAIPLVALALACYAITLAVAQLTSARGAVPIAGLVLLTLFLVNSLSHTFGWLER